MTLLCPFFLFTSLRPQVASLDTSQRTVLRNYAYFPPSKCFWAPERGNLTYYPLFPKKRKRTSSWRSMENCSGPNSWSVSQTHLKLGTGSTIYVESRDMAPMSRGQRSRSQDHVTHSDKHSNNSVLDYPVNLLGGTIVSVWLAYGGGSVMVSRLLNLA